MEGTPNYYLIRQNPYGKTNQDQLRDVIISQGLVTCPFGHFSEYRNNVIDELYNEKHPRWKSNSQDRGFMETLKIGDFILIPFTDRKECILAKIISEPIYAFESGLFWYKNTKNEYQIVKKGDFILIPFRPIVRKIEILEMNIQFMDKRVLPRRTFCKLNPSILPQTEQDLRNTWK
jgi:hypothetical protein